MDGRKIVILLMPVMALLLLTASVCLGDAMFPSPLAGPAPLKDLSITHAPDNAPGFGTLVCSCEPAGADIKLDGKSIGEAPLRREHIKEGQYTLTFSKAGYEDSSEKITIKKDVTLTIDERLAEARGEIKVVSDPQGASVFLDGSEAGEAPAVLTRISAGRHRISISKDYFEPQEVTVDVAQNQSREVSVQLNRRLLFINLYGGEGEKTLAAVSRLKGLKIISTSADKLKNILCSRDLDPSSLEFLDCAKEKLEMEDSAVLSSLLEQERAELALTITGKQEERGRTISLSLYCSHSSVPDVFKIRYDNDKELDEGLTRFTGQWEAQCSSSIQAAEAAPDNDSYLFNLALALIPAKQEPPSCERITLGNAYLRAEEFDKALKEYQEVSPVEKSGICRGTALYRMAEAYENMGLWTQAAGCYRELSLLYPGATLLSPDGPRAAPLATERLKALYQLGLVKERWWR